MIKVWLSHVIEFKSIYFVLYALNCIIYIHDESYKTDSKIENVVKSFFVDGFWFNALQVAIISIMLFILAHMITRMTNKPNQ